MDVREHIRDRMLEAGLSQTELARRIGCSLKHLNQFLNDRVDISGELLYRLAADGLGENEEGAMTLIARYAMERQNERAENA